MCNSINVLKANAIKTVMPAISAQVYNVMETLEPQTCGLLGFAIYTAMSSVHGNTEVPYGHMIGFVVNGIDIAHTRNRDLKQYHIQLTADDVLSLIQRLGYVHFEMSDVVVEPIISITDKWYDITSPVSATLPTTSIATTDNRRKSFVKGGKVKPSELMKECIEFLGSTPYHVEQPMLKLIEQVIAECEGLGKQLPECIKDEIHVIYGARATENEHVLYSEYDADARGRLYHIACAGPNPQSSDMARSLYSHNIENIVKKMDGDKTSKAYNMFIAELEDISGNGWEDSKRIRATAQRPFDALKYMLANEDKAPKKPFTYIRLAMDWVKFEEIGECDSRVGFGLDAKCSGTQYLAAIAGDMRMLKATGFITAGEGKGVDPYQLSLSELIDIIAKSSIRIDAEKYLNPKDGRNMIKTPYMSIQYGGSLKALMENQKFIKAMMEMGIDHNKFEQFARSSIDAIKEALGPKINNFIAKTQEAVAAILEKDNKAFITYRHTDGFKVLKPCFPSVEVCDCFSIRTGLQDRVIFGNEKDKTGWKIKAQKPTAEEYVRTFIVNDIQGIDALVARTVAVKAKHAHLRGFTSIHDCFRCCLADAPLMMDVIRDAYNEVFVKNNQFEHLNSQLHNSIMAYCPNLVTKELVYSEDAYYFCQ
ncbi:hypothetical protein I6H07_06335 [Hafnia alvei]|uniref:DNA-directed RNA polymerase n=1 Tax=Hafnia alvei TaxID=569 RepID=UPI000B6422FF|nr:DNA-directed RNA polymerase [Hafnia alvei]MBI0275451.1 hypothetical protein [Hafnia alvei]PNK98553.1 hypothetical protein CEQ28_013645 [Hafnia alvei]